MKTLGGRRVQRATRPHFLCLGATRSGTSVPAPASSRRSKSATWQGRLRRFATVGALFPPIPSPAPDDVVEPRRTELLGELREVFDRDAEFRRWADAWDLALLESASLLVDRLLPKEEARAAELSEIVTRDLHESPEGALSQRTIKGLADVAGVTSVLVGMRRPEYVRDAVGAFRG